MIPTDMPFQFKRLQFPVRLAFAMTITKAQGQSLQVCGLNLENSCFAHGQLYVACSRVGNPSDLFVYAPGGKPKTLCIQRHFNNHIYNTNTFLLRVALQGMPGTASNNNINIRKGKHIICNNKTKNSDP
jgi:ATP-dependent DNA helicase PIF1